MRQKANQRNGLVSTELDMRQRTLQRKSCILSINIDGFYQGRTNQTITPLKIPER